MVELSGNFYVLTSSLTFSPFFHRYFFLIVRTILPLPIFIKKPTLSILPPVFPLAFVMRAIRANKGPLTTPFVIEELSLVRSAIWPGHLSLPIHFV